jgi:hypothetical protein
MAVLEGGLWGHAGQGDRQGQHLKHNRASDRQEDSWTKMGLVQKSDGTATTELPSLHQACQRRQLT